MIFSQTGFRFFVIAFIISIAFCGCKKMNIERRLRIDLVREFQNDLVAIKIDNKLVFYDNVTTDGILSIAKSLHFDFPIGRYEISVSVNGKTFTEHFRHKEDRILLVYYNKNTADISISYPKELDKLD